MDQTNELTDSERMALLRDAVAELAPRLGADLDVLMHTTEPNARLDMARRVVQHAAMLRSASWNILRVANTELARLEREAQQ
jgi:hypothetical protein